MQKSTNKTSRKIYALKYALGHITLLVLTYFLINHLRPDTLNGSVALGAIGAIATIVGTLNIADGWKGHENKYDSDPD